MSQNRLSSDVREQDGKLLVSLRGNISEDSTLDQELLDARNRYLIIDTSGIVRINSFGVREWVRWVKGLEARGNQLYLVKCSPAIVAQLNMISNFVGSATVVSVLAPFLCNACQVAHLEELRIAGAGAASQPPNVICPNCTVGMEFDDDVEMYLSFAAAHVGRAPAPELEPLLSKP